MPFQPFFKLAVVNILTSLISNRVGIGKMKEYLRHYPKRTMDGVLKMLNVY